MATLRSEDVLDSVNEGFPSDSSDSGSEESSVPVKKSSVGCLADCSDEEPPSFSSLSVTSSVKKQKMEADKRLKRANAVARDISASTPRRTTSKPVRPRCLSHSAKSASKPVPKTKCSIFDFTSTGQDPGNASVEGDTADRPDIMCALKDISTTLNDLVNRVASTEKEIRSVKSTITHISSPSSSSESVNVKEGVPNIIRSETRKVYKTLEDEDDDFLGFNLGPSVNFKDAGNQRVVSKLIREVQATNPSFQACHIRAAAKTYFRSLKQDESLERRGKSGNRKKMRRQRERLLRKLQERQATFKKTPYQEKDREKWSKVLVYDLMSSEESGPDDGEENGCIVVKALPWRSSLVNKFLTTLDEKAKIDKSAQSLRQTKRRVIAEVASSRPKPCGHFPAWVFCED